MTKIPKLSIITPVYNGKIFIEACINNVISQNCNACEHIIMDGGSTDGTLEVIEKYAKKYPHIRYISEKDKGQSDAMNKGIKMARGEIISFLNVDDFYEPNIFNFIIKRFETLPSNSFLVGNCKVWDHEFNLIYINKPTKLSFRDMMFSNSKSPHPTNPSAYFYHKSLHDIVGYYEVTEHQVLDVDFILRASRESDMNYIDKHLGNFVKHKNCKTYIYDKYKDMSSTIFRIKLKYLRHLGFFDMILFITLRFLQIFWQIIDNRIGRVGLWIKKRWPRFYSIIKLKKNSRKT